MRLTAHERQTVLALYRLCGEYIMDRTQEVSALKEEFFDMKIKHLYEQNGTNVRLYLVVIVLVLIQVFAFPGNMLVEFWGSAFGIIFLAYILGKSVENIAEHTTATIGALMAASLANGTEMIIGFFAIQHGEMDILKASITGSLIGQMLFVSGMAIFFGGLKHKIQYFNKINAQVLATLLLLCMFAFLLPTLINTFNPDLATWLSVPIGVILFILYLAFLYFSMVSHKEIIRFKYASEQAEGDASQSEENEDRPGISSSLVWLVISGLTIGFFAERLIGAVEEATLSMGLNSVFVGVFIIAIAGNAAENSSAIWFSWKNKLDLALNVTLGSSIQIALLVVPVFVIMSALLGREFNLVFTSLEMMAVAFGTITMVVISNDGETNWFEGFILLMLYFLLGLVFYH
jgi:Ca2+:H+ antiporter